ncbi:MAG TPA: hypothetical protein VHC18_28710 [Amycolatopsis sp.]|nr:hypothetical protein [Amycolatopsis sp.]
MRLAVLTVLLLMAGCGAAEHPCTLIGTRVGLALDVSAVEPPAALTACWSGSCRDYPVDYYGSSGFAEIPDLPAAPVEVSVAGRTAAVTPRLLYPNGPDCGGGGPQAGLVLDETGLRPR